MWTIWVSANCVYFTANTGLRVKCSDVSSTVDQTIEEVERIIRELSFNPVSARTVFEALTADCKPKNSMNRKDVARAVKWLEGQGKLSLSLTKLKEEWAKKYKDQSNRTGKHLRIRGSAATLLISEH